MTTTRTLASSIVLVHLLAPRLAAGAPLPITEGKTDTEHPAVVAILLDDHPVCSGTLVAPTKVLTAAHCIGDAFVPEAIAVGQGTGAFTDQVEIVGVTRHVRFDGLHSDADVAMLELARPPHRITPVPITRRMLAIGESAMVVGYGRSGVDDVRVRRNGTVTITDIQQGSIVTVAGPAQVCGGDSGGPLLVVEGDQVAIAGVISQADPSCRSWGRVARVDVVASNFIEPQLAVRTLPTGARCFSHDACESGRCEPALDEPLARLCVSACDSSGGCPGATACDAASSTCRPLAPSPGAQGAACETRFDCMIGLCAVSGDETGRCAQPCGNDLDCRDEGTCAPSIDGPLACSPPAQPAAGGCSAAPNDPTAIVCALLVVVVALQSRRRHSPRRRCRRTA